VSVHLITGIGGQDGILLGRHLRGRGEQVIGTIRPGSDTRRRLQVYLPDVVLVEHDIRDDEGFSRLLTEHRPDRVYNLAANSSVGGSWREPEVVLDLNGAAVGRLLERLGEHRVHSGREVRFCQASSAEETTEASSSPYARAKAIASAAVTRARQQGLFAARAVLHNHESPLRGPAFVTRKITMAAAQISLGTADHVDLGNLDVVRDWGAAADHVVALDLMLSLDEPQDVRIATGRTHTLHDLLETAFATAGLDEPMRYVRQSEALLRPADNDVVAAPPEELERTAELLGWRASTSFHDVIAGMVAADLARLRTGVAESPSYLARPTTVSPDGVALPGFRSPSEAPSSRRASGRTDPGSTSR
jgi:GDPmannose 4,6-dehydratase